MPYEMSMTSCAKECQHVSQLLRKKKEFSCYLERESLEFQGFPQG